MTEYEVLPGQSLFDLALQHYGSVEAVEWLLLDNPGRALTDLPAPGTRLLIRPEVMDRRVKQYLDDFAPLATA